jgi:hypothetical protein
LKTKGYQSKRVDVKTQALEGFEKNLGSTFRRAIKVV